jgi:hypothetical protein
LAGAADFAQNNMAGIAFEFGGAQHGANLWRRTGFGQRLHRNLHPLWSRATC